MNILDFSSDPILFILYSIIILVWGLCLGSFTTAIIPRELNGTSWFSLKGQNARSHCAMCNRQLTWRELIPIFSYLIQKRRCACGDHLIPIFYPLTEVLIFLTTVMIFLKYEISMMSLGLTLSIPFAATCFWMNIQNRMATDRMLIVLAYIAVGTALFTIPETNLFDSIYGAIGAGGVGMLVKILADRFSSRPLLSWDVIKLWAIIGFWLGIGHIGYFLFLMGLGGTLWILFPSPVWQRYFQSFPYISWSLLVFAVLMLWF